jgi:extracellular matrix regulatory protein A
MHAQLIDVGFNYTIVAKDIIAVMSPDSAAVKRMVANARDRHQLNDASEGRMVRSVIITDPYPFKSDRVSPPPPTITSFSRSSVGTLNTASERHLILSAIQPDTLANRSVFKSLNRQSRLSSTESLAVMDIKLINIGFGNIVCANRVVAIVSPESAPIKRIISDARERGQLVDATYGRRTRAVIVTDVGHIILSAIQPETVANRFVAPKES